MITVKFTNGQELKIDAPGGQFFLNTFSGRFELLGISFKLPEWSEGLEIEYIDYRYLPEAADVS